MKIGLPGPCTNSIPPTLLLFICLLGYIGAVGVGCCSEGTARYVPVGFGSRPLMTLDRPAPVVVDEFPRRPAVMRFLAVHAYCCLAWRSKAGSCSSEPVRAPDGYQTSGSFEAAVDQRVDFDMALQKLPAYLQRVIDVVATHGPRHLSSGDPGGRLASGAYIEGRDGKFYDEDESFWVEYGHLIGCPDDWQRAAALERKAYRQMATTLGWGRES